MGDASMALATVYESMLRNRFRYRGWHWTQALMALAEFQARRGQADVVVYNGAISACGNVRQWQRVLELLLDMCRLTVQPSVITQNAAISACAKGQQWHLAVVLFAQMQQRQLIPDVI